MTSTRKTQRQIVAGELVVIVDGQRAADKAKFVHYGTGFCCVQFDDGVVLHYDTQQVRPFAESLSIALN